MHSQGCDSQLVHRTHLFRTLERHTCGLPSILAECVWPSINGMYPGASPGYACNVSADISPATACPSVLPAQVFSGLPLTLLLIYGLPRNNLESHTLLYACVTLTFGVCIAWSSAGCNSPIFSEIVPPRLRSQIYAFDRCFEGALAACAAPLVGMIAERGFGYRGVIEEGNDSAASAHNHANGLALGNSLAVCLLLPWSLCGLCYIGAPLSMPVRLSIRAPPPAYRRVAACLYAWRWLGRSTEKV